MTSSSDTLQGLRTETNVAPLRAKWGWIVALGVVYVVAGFVVLGSVVTAPLASALVVGAMMIIAGVAEARPWLASRSGFTTGLTASLIAPRLCRRDRWC